jgi:hypothetical protein
LKIAWNRSTCLFSGKPWKCPKRLRAIFSKLSRKNRKRRRKEKARTAFPSLSQTDEKVRNAFAPKRADGVTDEDIAFWWNMHDLERRLICKVDEMNRILLFEKLVKNDNVPEAEAARMVAGRFPVYGDPEHLVLGTDDDRPLPFELKWRVNRYISERTEKDPDGFREEAEASTSLNALLRRAIRENEL